MTDAELLSIVLRYLHSFAFFWQAGIRRTVRTTGTIRSTADLNLVPLRAFSNSRIRIDLRVFNFYSTVIKPVGGTAFLEWCGMWQDENANECK